MLIGMEGETQPEEIPPTRDSETTFLRRCRNRVLTFAHQLVLFILSFRTSIIKIIRTPWVAAVLFLYTGVVCLWSIFYNPTMLITPIFLSIAFLLSIFALWDIVGGTNITSSEVTPRVTLVTIFWWFLWISFSQGGYTRYFHNLVDSFVFFFALTFMSILLIWVTNANIERNHLGLAKGRMKLSLFFIMLGFLVYAMYIFGELVSVDLRQLTSDEVISLTITSTLLPAIFEEITIRGILLGQLTRHTKSRLSGVLLSSLVFGAGHLLSNASSLEGDLIAGLLSGFIFQFIRGLIYGGIYTLTGSIFATSIIHYQNNFTVWLNARFGVNEFAAVLGYIGSNFAFLISLLLILGSLFNRFKRYDVSLIESDHAEDMPIDEGPSISTETEKGRKFKIASTPTRKFRLSQIVVVILITLILGTLALYHREIVENFERITPFLPELVGALVGVFLGLLLGNAYELRKRKQITKRLEESVIAELQHAQCLASLQNQNLLPTAAWRLILNSGHLIELFDPLTQLYTRIENHNYEMIRVADLLFNPSISQEEKCKEFKRACRLESEITTKIGQVLEPFSEETCKKLIDTWACAKERALERKKKYSF
jgi:membrane protease YdiL (CAAX protease family)